MVAWEQPRDTKKKQFQTQELNIGCKGTLFFVHNSFAGIETKLSNVLLDLVFVEIIILKMIGCY
jgi:hypothetical protein